MLTLLGDALPWATTGALAFLLWLVLFIWLGIRTLRRGHWVMFLVGIIFPLWVIGALVPRRG